MKDILLVSTKICKGKNLAIMMIYRKSQAFKSKIIKNKVEWERTLKKSDVALKLVKIKNSKN